VQRLKSAAAQHEPLRWEGNLKELRQRLEEYAATSGIAVSSPTPEAELMSQSLPLAHSTTGEALSDICGCGQILSTERVAASRGTSLKADSAEGQLGTAGFVFFYLGPFRYPSTGSGLLFARSLEEDHGDDGVATPFDSGGLIEKFTRADPAEPPREFLSRHELPVPDHREYLGLSLGVLFAKPIDYLEGEEPRWPGPIGLAEETGGGGRMRCVFRMGWSPGRAPASGFVAASRDADRRLIVLEWCMAEGVDWFPFDAPRGTT